MEVANISDARSRNMRAIRNKDTKPELLLRRLLHNRGYRYRLHVKDLPGKPDIVFPKFHAIVQVHGCFWHGHGCYLFKWPIARREFWEEKINGNRTRDKLSDKALKELGWRVLIVWECALKGRLKQPEKTLMEEIEKWLHNISENEYSQFYELQNINHNTLNLSNHC